MYFVLVLINLRLMTAFFNGFAPLCLSITLQPVSDHRLGLQSKTQQTAQIMLVPKLETDTPSALSLASCPSQKKKYIPKKMREMVWDKYIGENIAVSPCWCCQSTNIKNTDFVCGHVIAESCGGDTNVDNMRPICSMCNLSMGTKNMHEFMKLLGKKPRDDINGNTGDSLWKHLNLVGLKSACEFFGKKYKTNDSRKQLIFRLSGTDSSVFLLQMLNRLSSDELSALSVETKTSLAKSIASNATPDIFKHLSIRRKTNGQGVEVSFISKPKRQTSLAEAVTEDVATTTYDSHWAKLGTKYLKEACLHFRLSASGTRDSLIKKLSKHNCRAFLESKTVAQLKGMVVNHCCGTSLVVPVSKKKDLVSLLLTSSQIY
jgi:5-methylcytosine-specific restriction endonuclease McrA